MAAGLVHRTASRYGSAMIRILPLPLLAALLLAGCSSPDDRAAPLEADPDPQVAFMERLSELCGQAFAGQLVSDDPADAEIAAERLVMHVADCAPDRIRIPFHVGDDRSRTWVITDTGTGLLLKHDHRHADGSEDAVTQYGGETDDPGNATRQEFPVDAESIALFEREGLTASVANVWAMEADDARFAYELRRPAGENERFFRVEFDLTAPVETPPAAWGSE
ncbi:hypothetical protein [Parasphingopyxis algicola]|uniref:hypothetical protein n=1 Tax=Parasphingopyxis algicola TaxID=2026624 RepID=UPI001FECCD1D|nr:hypothetical protein [Parasphingopyxis algicola]